MKYDGFSGIELKTFAQTLQTEHYDSIEQLCADIKKQAKKINGLEQSETSTQYVSKCEKIVSDIENHVSGRKGIYIPYVDKLSDKVKDNHDCTNCSGTCRVNHDMHIMELHATNESMKKVLSRLQMISLPLYSETMFPDEYRRLRSNMTLLETSIAELFFLENNYLIPKIADAQKSINAGGK